MKKKIVAGIIQHIISALNTEEKFITKSVIFLLVYTFYTKFCNNIINKISDFRCGLTFV